MKGAFLLFKFIGDAAYPMRPWFYSPFKGEEDGLSRENDGLSRENILEFYTFKH